MKKFLNTLLFPAAIAAVMLLLVSASFAADEIITGSRNSYLAVMGQENPITDLTLIIDPGHGGADGGAVSATGGNESVLNLEISKKIELMAAFFGVNSVMTRETEDIIYPDNTKTIRDKKIYDSKSRVNLINNTPNAVLISVHQNKFDDSSVKGSQVFFRESQYSAELAESISQNLMAFAEIVRPSKEISDTIYIFKHIDCPAVLVECGYISNHSENELLQQNEYQVKIALASVFGYLQYEKTQLSKLVGGIYESKDGLLLH